MARRQVTLIEVAQNAGTSLATASRVLNGSSRRVSDALRERVVESARALGYIADASAQALARSSSPVVGLIVHDIADPYFSSIAAGVIRVAEERQLVVVLGTTGRDADRELELVSTLRSHRARAIVLAGSRSTDTARTRLLAEELARFTERGGRAVCISQARLPADTVVPANRSGARQLARALAGLGHTRFAVLGGPRELLTARDRVSGFRAGLSEAGISLQAADVLHGEFTRDGGYEAAQELLRRRSDVTCLFAVNDVMATGAMAALRDAGLTVPVDMSVAGFDNIPTLRDLTPGLSTVALPLERMGEVAAELAFDEDADASSEAGTDGEADETNGEEEPGRHRTVRIAAEVVLRESTAAPAR
ncbi:LacI family DNA-binding transcriptional regulator [Pseudonocardia nigra]|uniref:LacI family DNA-binding transcriptional regulator n=1 Tax=Pseudonocardia nigra TaxID=1921578 RepID=UPI001C5CCCB7|nr:LacI family DNA-binding transcriptional regulator [Pseudonocardia nigra]